MVGAERNAMFSLDAVDAYDMCANRVEIIKELLLDSTNRGVRLPKDEAERELAERAIRYLEAAMDVADAALREHDSFVRQQRAA